MRPNQYSSAKRHKELEKQKKKEEKLQRKKERKAAIAAGLIDADGNPLDADGNIIPADTDDDDDASGEAGDAT